VCGVQISILAHLIIMSFVSKQSLIGIEPFEGAIEQRHAMSDEIINTCKHEKTFIQDGKVFCSICGWEIEDSVEE